MEDYQPKKTIDTPYLSSKNPPTTEDTKRTINQFRRGIENDKFIKLRKEEREKPLP